MPKAATTTTHQAKARKRGGQPGNHNAETHGFYSTPKTPPETIEQVIAGLAAKQARLDALMEDPDREDLITLFSLYSQNASRLGRLLRDKRALSNDAAEGIAGAIAQALSELSTELDTAVPL